MNVVATTGMVADIVKVVAGPHANVIQMIGSGVDPHLHKPSRDDVQLIMRADIVFYSGLMLEGKMSDTFVKLARSKPVIAVTEAIDPAVLLEPEEMSGHLDPHVWNDVSAWSQCVGAVQQALSEFDPAHSKDYALNATKYQAALAELHEYGIKSIATIPQDQRILVTSHDAFNYFGRAYHLKVMGVQGISTESEAGIQRINQLVDTLVENDVRAVFIESSVSPKNIDALIEGAQSKNHPVVIGGELYSDAMGPAGTYEGTYMGMLDHNITIVTLALGGKAPQHGLHGKLQASSHGAKNHDEALETKFETVDSTK
ncbi:Periplasmic zinc-binding protein TroA precursor [Rubripirellula amarantea]|uniref:Periplasmic zinc-binding protein TroA n=1 Tax=Rubripirellula amarantea TaxID=2527999 RepID=A0A5C5WUZ7_9BACT|nr:zinc ABC transporter substrate-binding protein [Rubripirellula amarantea]TWT54079.1 Periplasmic zinc-binding protein TroA precursor [Rubripirellula amarantea]